MRSGPGVGLRSRDKLALYLLAHGTCEVVTVLPEFGFLGGRLQSLTGLGRTELALGRRWVPPAPCSRMEPDFTVQSGRAERDRDHTTLAPSRQRAPVAPILVQSRKLYVTLFHWPPSLWTVEVWRVDTALWLLCVWVVARTKRHRHLSLRHVVLDFALGMASLVERGVGRVDRWVTGRRAFEWEQRGIRVARPRSVGLALLAPTRNAASSWALEVQLTQRALGVLLPLDGLRKGLTNDIGYRQKAAVAFHSRL